MKINILLAITFLSFITYGNLDYLHGITGMTLRDGGIGCVCHGTEPTISVNVWIEGTDSLIINQTAQYKLLMTGGSAIKGGFNVASYFGTLNSIDTLVSLISGELTHSSPNPFSNDTVSWNFSYTAPDSLTIDTIYSVANSVNGNGNPSQDQWDFGQNFIIHIIDNPVKIEKEYFQPEGFVLYQNYPNPFNPTTTISYQISNKSFIIIKLYDVNGSEIAILVNETKPAGNHTIQFNGSSLTSGIYFYQLQANNYIETKKFVLIK